MENTRITRNTTIVEWMENNTGGFRIRCFWLLEIVMLSVDEDMIMPCNCHIISDDIVKNVDFAIFFVLIYLVFTPYI